MKKIISVILSLILLICPLCISSNAQDEKYPIIIVPGYSTSCLYKDGENGEKDRVWNIVIEDIIEKIIVNAGELGIDLAYLAKGDAKKLADTVGKAFIELYGDMAYDEDGKSVAELKTYHSSAAEVNTKYLNENEDGQYIHEFEIMPYVTQNLGEKADEWTFNFNTDFRQNVLFCALDLAKLVKDVKDYTKSDKVNILAVSHGGQVSATYLSFCAIASKGGAEANELASFLGMTVDELKELFNSNDIHNALLTVPAIGGAVLAYDVMTNQVKLDEETLMFFISNGMMFETDIDWLLKAEQLGFLDDFICYLQPYLMQVLGCWGSMWDFVPLNQYEEVKTVAATDRFLKSDVIKVSDYFHSEIMANMTENLQYVENHGTNVYILAGTGAPGVTGSKINSDAIISVNASTGATVAPYTQRFSNGYETLKTECDNKTHSHLSPKMDIDVSTCYLPDETWFVEGLFHGMTIKDKYTSELMRTLVESESKADVYTFKDFPQFRYSTNTCHTVDAYFNSSVPGYLDKNDTSLVISNLSNKSKLIILDITSDSDAISFDIRDYFGKAIEPQTEITVEFNGEVPPVSLETVTVKVSYMLVGSVTPVNTRAFTYTVMNGEKSQYDTQNPFTDFTKDTQFKDAVTATDIGQLLYKTNLGAIAELFFNILRNILVKAVALIVQ